MGREVRRVIKNWQHPKYENGNYIPLLGDNFSEQLATWEEGNKQWENGFVDDWNGGWKPKEEKHKDISFEEWDGEKPLKEDYMPEWDEKEKTHIQMYEDTSEGTPISPVFDNAEEMARWLADNGASSFGDSTATYEQWLACINRGWSPSMVIDNNGLRSGVEALS